ncbi:hypothetical protein CLV84_2161 [Neolewinella xylanilytica]|uniref:Uncharacterized protein n=1 Tax=Neolewinella xylanilytica TaxID=1514080 RepID=A0A2S6I2G9_9BACT|nr:hypothetical protein [Neolewinella xylanilytica]PPK85269.1 hypothetical protein CLV84_2161 [Neolewinella xylanilytica]
MNTKRTPSEKKVRVALLSVLRYIGERDILFYFLVAVATACLYPVAFGKAESTSLPALTIAGSACVSILTAAYVLDKLPHVDRILEDWRD